MGGVGLRLRVCLPDVHLGAAGAVVAGARVGVVVGRHPVVAVGLPVDPLHVVRALSVAVTSAVPSTVRRYSTY